MRIVSEKPLRDFWQKYPSAETPLRNWIQATKAADWDSFADVKNTFRAADAYKRCVIFDIGGNNYRLTAKINYRIKIVFVRAVMTHKEYDSGFWKSDCEV